MNERRKTAFAFAQDATKQLITLATGVIALTITFFHEFATSAPEESKRWMEWSWAVFVLSIVAGFWTLNALTGSLEPKTHDEREPSIRGSNVVVPSWIQIVLFLLALGFTVNAGRLALR